MDAVAINATNLALLRQDQLPYADAKQVRELLRSAGRVRIPFQYNATDYAAGTKQYFVSPIKGAIVKLSTTVQTLTAGAGALSINVNGKAAITGLGQTIATASAVGTNQQTRVNNDDALAAVNVDQGIELQVNATPTAGAINGYFEIEPL